METWALVLCSASRSRAWGGLREKNDVPSPSRAFCAMYSRLRDLLTVFTTYMLVKKATIIAPQLRQRGYLRKVHPLHRPRVISFHYRGGENRQDAQRTGQRR